MPRILDTAPDFDAFARSAFLESPAIREQLWQEHYEAAHPEVFAVFYERHGDTENRASVVRDLSTVRKRVREAAPVERRLIEEVEPAVQRALGVPATPSPRHVLLVGSFSTNADVARLNDEVTLFHCLEWFHSEEGMRVLVAHEDSHAWHQIALGASPPEADPAWMAFYEGVAIAASRAVVPGRPDEDYFWYGHGGFADWLPWCREQSDQLLERFRSDLEDPAAVETWFGAGLVEQRWRVGYFVADVVVERLGRPLPELVSMTVDDAQSAVREVLANS
ncbi:MAG: hypothetical protein M3N25_00355 [Actinomycetota bacterium]|nr:hypothetical protein [Actinomycetota bacterium]